MNCYVFCGFPEKCNENGKEVYYNSCLITDREGKSLPSYKKTFLYETDKVIFNYYYRTGVLKEKDSVL